MSRRRKTLCHAEIENFLSELQTDAAGDLPVDATQGTMLTKPGIDISPTESTHIAPTEDEVALEKHLKMRNTVRCFVKHSFSLAKQSDAPVPAVHLAKTVKETCGYNLLPMRMLQPEIFEHSPETIESKRAVLISLGPMLDEAEKQRKLDVSLCEDITRCRIESKRTRTSWYRYSDLDSSELIDPSEYETRYIKFLHHVKRSRSEQTDAARGERGDQPTLLSKERSVLLPISENIQSKKSNKESTTMRSKSAEASIKSSALPKSTTATENDENVMLTEDLRSPRSKKTDKPTKDRHRRSSISDTKHSDRVSSRSKSSSHGAEISRGNIPSYVRANKSPQGSPSGKEKTKPSVERRATLSPGKMKAMLEIALADDEDEASGDESSFVECNTGPVPTEETATDGAQDALLSAAAELGHFLASTDRCERQPLNEDVEAVEEEMIALGFDDPDPLDVDVLNEAPVAEDKADDAVAVEDTTAADLGHAYLGTACISASTEETNIEDVEPIAQDNKEAIDFIISEKSSEGPQVVERALGSVESSSEAESISWMEEAKDCPRDRARCRLFLRLEVARWKHGWEMASLDAAEAAHLKFPPQTLC